MGRCSGAQSRASGKYVVVRRCQESTRVLLVPLPYRPDLNAQVAAVEVAAPAVGGGEEGEEVREQVAEQRDQRVVVAERAAREVRRVAPLVGEQL